jgi:hypothetical protein
MKKGLRKRLGTFQVAKNVKLVKNSLFNWFRKMTIEMKTRKLERQRLKNTYCMVISALERHRDIH